MVAARDLKSFAERRVGSSPAPGTRRNMDDDKDSKRRRPIGMIVTIIIVLSLIFYLVAKFAG